MIVTCGEALVDLMPVRVDGELLFRPVLGGSLFNVAIGVARLGGQAGYHWELSRDAMGTAFYQELLAAGVCVDHVCRSRRATPVAIVDSSDGEPRYAIADPDLVMRDTAVVDIGVGADIVQIGSAVLAHEPVGSAIERWARSATLVSIDYNVRPPSIDDMTAYRARLRRLSAHAGVVKASTADLELIGENDPAGYMLRCVEDGAAVAVLTAAEEGATAFTRQSQVTVPSFAAEIVDTVGAGDAFMAGFLVALQKSGALTRERLEALDDTALFKAMTFAQKTAAASCSRRGAVMPHLSELATDG